MNKIEARNPLTGKYSASLGALALVCLLLLALTSRFWLADWPNFKPIGAVAIFAGFFCQRKSLALIGVVAIMLVSDAVIGFYEPMVMLSVYASLLLACGLGMMLKKRMRNDSKMHFKVGAVSAASLVAAVLFYLLTNTAVWAAGWYPGDLNGWVAALVAGLPFFKFTLAGNLLFSGLLFSLFYAFLTPVYGSFQQSNTLAAQQVRRLG